MDICDLLDDFASESRVSTSLKINDGPNDGEASARGNEFDNSFKAYMDPHALQRWAKEEAKKLRNHSFDVDTPPSREVSSIKSPNLSREGSHRYLSAPHHESRSKSAASLTSERDLSLNDLVYSGSSESLKVGPFVPLGRHSSATRTRVNTVLILAGCS